MNEQATWQFDNQDVTLRAVHEVGHAVVGHVIGQLIEEVFIVSDGTGGYKGYCRFSALVEAANDHYQWQEASKTLITSRSCTLELRLSRSSASCMAGITSSYAVEMLTIEP